MLYFFCILIGYLLGSINCAYIIAKIKGFDIRTKGSTNAGASNAAVTMGFRVGIIVGFFDIFKAFLSIYIVKSLFPSLEYASIVAGVACILGHIFPFYLKFRGGKGFASYMGMILALDWKLFIALAITTVLITLLTDYIALATLTTVIVYPVYLLINHISIIAILVVFIATIVMIFKHIDNIKRIIKGTEIGFRKVKAKTNS